MVNLPEVLTSHTVQVRDRLGSGSGGEVFGDWREVPRCQVEDKRKILIDDAGAQVVSTGRVFIRPEYGPIPLHSEVKVWPGTANERIGKVQQVNYHDHTPAPTYYEVWVV